jgi:ABC-type Mn2+/Zn2+ transport system permease subunit
LDKTVAGLPPAQRAPAATAARSAFTTGLDHILLVAAIIALVSGVLALALIRTRDFYQPEPAG